MLMVRRINMIMTGIVMLLVMVVVVVVVVVIRMIMVKQRGE